MINSFSSYFELFAGLNLGYATIRGFRDAVNTELFGVVTKHKDLESKLGLITNKVILTFSESSKEYDKTTKFRKEFDDDRSLLEKELKNIIGLGIGFQILFRVVCIFCFSILILGGFENYFDNKVSTLKILSISNLLFISFFAFFLIVRYYFKSFINYSAGIIVLIYFFIQCIPLILYIFQFSIIKNSDYIIYEAPNSIPILIVLLFIPPFPFILFYFRRYKQSKQAQTEIDNFTIKYKNKLDGFTTGIGISIQD